MADIQQQIADGARPLARVGDVIAHGEAIPANVARMLDVESDYWIRVPKGWHLEGSGNLPTDLPHRDYWPMHVVAVTEVDPEPQPAAPIERHCYDSAEHLPHTWVYAPGTNAQAVYACDGAARQPPESGPVVLSVPQAPDGAVGYVGEMTGHRWSPTEFGRFVDETTGQVRGWLQMLGREGSVTVEFAPPREPRTWPKLDPPAADVLRVRGASGTTWERHGTDDGAWHNEDHSRVRSWGALALEDGPLTEVPL